MRPRRACHAPDTFTLAAMIPAKPIIRVTVWGEYRHEKHNPKVARIYPQGMHQTIADALAKLGGTDFAIRTATLDEPEHGLTDAVLDATDVLTWWGHMAHGDVSDAIVAKVRRRVLEGAAGARAEASCDHRVLGSGGPDGACGPAIRLRR